MTRGGEATFTPLLAFVVLWVVLATFNFGFGTSELNPLQRAITCPPTSSDDDTSSLFSPAPCIALTNAEFGYITAGFTAGGFVGSVGLSPLKAHVALLRRSKNALILSGAWSVIGGLVQASAASWPVLAAGRACMGVGSGIALVVVPGYLNDISPPSWQGSIGVLNQLSIVIGILSAQALGVSKLGDAPSPKSNGPWRFIPLISAALAALQLLLAPFAVDAPSEKEDAQRVRERLWGLRNERESTSDGAEAESLLTPPDEPDADSGDSSASSSGIATNSNITIARLLRLAIIPSRSPTRDEASMGRGTRMILVTQLAQQLSGVNAVLYFGTGIMSDVIGGDSTDEAAADRTARFIGLGITAVNFLMTFPPIPLIDERRLGRKLLFQLSSGIMAIASAVLAVALLRSYSVLAAASIVVFVAAFSLGLGPIPFLVLPELVPHAAVATASSLGIGANWLANILLATAFLPLKDALGPNVFFIFVAINVTTFALISRFYVYSAPSRS